MQKYLLFEVGIAARSVPHPSGAPVWHLQQSFIQFGFTNMRKQINGLAELVLALWPESPFDGSSRVFCGKTRRVLKILCWDATGFCLWQKWLFYEAEAHADEAGASGETVLPVGGGKFVEAWETAEKTSVAKETIDLIAKLCSTEAGPRGQLEAGKLI
ncbi:MAG: IS66 family insertion sequence element accessory protein TnpB [Anaerolineae bacterium]